MDVTRSASRKQIITLMCISKGFRRVEVLEGRHRTGSLFLGGNGRQKASWEKAGGSSRGEGFEGEAAESLLVAQ